MSLWMKKKSWHHFLSLKIEKFNYVYTFPAIGVDLLLSELHDVLLLSVYHID